MKSLTSIVEARAADDVLYHFTNLVKLNSILKGNEFLLTTDVGRGADAALRGNNGAFYLSTTRHKLGGYNLSPHRGVMLVLDGNKLSHNLRIKAVDYWGQDFREINPSKQEAEDRVYSDKQTIPNAMNYIREIHVLDPTTIDDSQDGYKRVFRQSMLLAKTNNIPFYFYNNEQDFLLQRNPIDVPIQDLKLDDPNYKPYSPRGRKYLAPLVELIMKPADQELSKDARKLAYNMSVYSDTYRSIDADMHNDSQSKHAGVVTMFMSRNHLNSTQELTAFLNKKWQNA